MKQYRCLILICTSCHKLSVSVLRNITSLVSVPPKINRDNLNLDPDVVINQTTVINCPVEGKPAPVITWYKNGVQLDATLQKRYEILAGGRQLRVKKAQLTDTGTYHCLAVNKAGEDSVDFELTVLGSI